MNKEKEPGSQKTKTKKQSREKERKYIETQKKTHTQ